jgi:hypothetical protein
MKYLPEEVIVRTNEERSAYHYGTREKRRAKRYVYDDKGYTFGGCWWGV